MQEIFIIVFLLSSLLFIIGILSPQLSLFWDNKERTRKKSAKIYVIISFISFILVGITLDTKKSNTSTAQQIVDNTSKQVEHKPKQTEKITIPEPVKQTSKDDLTEQVKKAVKSFWAYNKFPTCDSYNSKQTLIGAFNNSQYARTLNLSAIDISGAKELGIANDDIRNCSATILMNNTQSLNVTFNWKMNSDKSQYLLTMKEKI